jgi:hypothetical protein
LRTILNGLFGHFYDLSLMSGINADRGVSDRVRFDHGTVQVGIKARRREDYREIVESHFYPP